MCGLASAKSRGKGGVVQTPRRTAERNARGVTHRTPNGFCNVRRSGSSVIRYEPCPATAAASTTSSLGSRLTVRLSGTAVFTRETRLSQSSQPAQFGLRQRFSSAATWATDAVHSSTNSAVHTERNARRASRRSTWRESPPRQPIPATTTEVSSAATSGMTFPFHLADQLDDRGFRFRPVTAVGIEPVELLAQSFGLGLLEAAHQFADDLGVARETLARLLLAQPLDLCVGEGNVQRLSHVTKVKGGRALARSYRVRPERETGFFMASNGAECAEKQRRSHAGKSQRSRGVGMRQT